MPGNSIFVLVLGGGQGPVFHVNRLSGCFLWPTYDLFVQLAFGERAEQGSVSVW